MKNIAIGVDVGGSHVSCAACSINEKKYMPETLSENDLDNQASANEIIDVWSRTIQSTMDKAGIDRVTGIGFAMPGPFDYANGIALFRGNNKKYESIYGLNVREALREKMNLPSDFPIRFINDATAFAIGEDWIGKASGSAASLSVTLGTGFGSAFLANHMPVVSGQTVPATGAVWHLPFEDGSADDYFSTRGLLNRYEMHSGIKLSGVKELAQLAHSDAFARAEFMNFGYKLGLFLHPWIEKANIEVLVIGGNISNAYSLFGKALHRYLTTNGIRLRVEVSELKEKASMIGSAVLIDDQYYNRIAPLISLM